MTVYSGYLNVIIDDIRNAELTRLNTSKLNGNQVHITFVFIPKLGFERNFCSNNCHIHLI